MYLTRSHYANGSWSVASVITDYHYVHPGEIYTTPWYWDGADYRVYACVEPLGASGHCSTGI